MSARKPRLPMLIGQDGGSEFGVSVDKSEDCAVAAERHEESRPLRLH